MAKPLSLLELSLHERLTWVAEAAAAARPVGATGGLIPSPCRLLPAFQAGSPLA